MSKLLSLVLNNEPLLVVLLLMVRLHEFFNEKLSVNVMMDEVVNVHCAKFGKNFQVQWSFSLLLVHVESVQ